MPYSPCEPCCDGGAAASRTVDTYRSSVLLLLCQLVGGSPGPDPDTSLELLHVSGLATTSGDNPLIAAPAADEALYIYRIKCTYTNITTALLGLFQDSANVEYDRFIAQTPASVSGGFVDEVTPSGYLFKVAAGEPLVLNNSTADDVHYSISYFIGAA